MPYKDPEKRKEYHKQWQKKNRDKCNKNNNKYNNSLTKEQKTIKDWRHHKKMKLREGEDWDSIYLFYITCEICERCGVKLTEGSGKLTSRNLDHDHSTGYIRNVVCWDCNINKIK